MYASDFLFDNQCASDLGLIICSFNGEFETASGGEIEYNVVKTPGRDRFTFYGAQLNSTIEWKFSICKNPCRNDELYFNQYEESMIVKWLLKTDGNKPLQFLQEGYETIIYNVRFNITPYQITGRTVGFNLTATSDCAYGFTDMIKKKTTINATAPFKLNIHSDINTYILPIIKINGTGSFSINNYRDIELKDSILEKPVILENISQKIKMDSDKDIITGLNSPDDFNWHFMKLADGNNIITTDSVDNIDIEIQYREPRYVRV